jgi:hypothetical protein
VLRGLPCKVHVDRRALSVGPATSTSGATTKYRGAPKSRSRASLDFVAAGLTALTATIKATIKSTASIICGVTCPELANRGVGALVAHGSGRNQIATLADENTLVESDNDDR